MWLLYKGYRIDIELRPYLAKEMKRGHIKKETPRLFSNIILNHKLGRDLYLLPVLNSRQKRFDLPQKRQQLNFGPTRICNHF